MRARFATIPVVEQGVQVCSSMPARCSTDTTQQLKRTPPHPKPTVLTDRELERRLQLYKQDPMIDYI